MSDKSNFPKDFTFEEAKDTILSFRRQFYAVPFLVSSMAIVFSDANDFLSVCLVGILAFLLSALMLYLLTMIETLNTTRLLRVPGWLLPVLSFALPIIVKLLFIHAL